MLRINNLISKRKGELSDLFQTLEFNDRLKNLTSKELFSLVRSQSDDTTTDFIKIMEVHAEELHTNGKYTNAEHFKSTISKIKSYVGNTVLDCKDVNLDFIKGFEQHYLNESTYRHGKTQKKCLNGLAPHLRRVRVIINKLITAGILSENQSPFKKYTIRTEKTEKRSLTIEQISKIKNLSLEEGSILWHARNYFMMSFYTQGASLTDLARLTVNDINDGIIRYRRAKTNQPITVHVSEQLRNIIDIYLSRGKSGTYILPIIKASSTKEKQILRDIHSALIRINQSLRDIAGLADIEAKYLSTYWARHSYANNLKKRNVPIEAISQSLGHGNLKTTEIYLGELDTKVIADYNKELFSELEATLSKA
jgi:integrase